MSTKRKTTAAPKKERETTVKTVSKKTVSKKTGAKKSAGPTSEMIAALAYEYWERDGRPEGRAEEHWREAEAWLVKSGGRA